MALPGVNSVIVPPPSVVVVVEVVVSETWAHANGAAAATAMLSSSFFIFWLSFFGLRAGAPCPVETEIAGCSNYHKSIATLPIDGCVTSKTKSYISLNKSGTRPVRGDFPFSITPWRRHIVANGTNHVRRGRGVASDLHRRWRH